MNPHAPSACRLRLVRAFVTITALVLLALPAAGADQVPFVGQAEGAVVALQPEGGGLALSTEARGRATHLGRFTRVEQIHLDPATGAFAGQAVFEAADGATLTAEVAGVFVSPTEAAGTYDFVGGTGRFAAASGAASFVLVSEDGIHFSVKFRGSLSSVGSSPPGQR